MSYKINKVKSRIWIKCFLCFKMTKYPQLFNIDPECRTVLICPGCKRVSNLIESVPMTILERKINAI